MNRREFLTVSSSAALAGCLSSGGESVRPAPASSPGAEEYHVFSKMFQSPVTASPEALCELMAKAGYDGIQWTVRAKGHCEPAEVKTVLPRLCRAAERQGLKNRTICTDITTDSPYAEEVLRVAADCGISLFRPAYFFYDQKKESFRESLERIRRGFAYLAGLAERTGVRATYQNHSSWGPSVFGGLVWDIHACVKDLDPQHVGVEYDPMHAYFETNLSWSHGFDLIAPWIGAIDLKDFHYGTDPRNPKKMKKRMVAAGEGIVPWKEVKALAESNRVRVPRIVHFEYDFDKTDLLKSVRTELEAFKRV